MKNKKLLTNILFAVVILAIAAVLLVVRRVHASGSGLRAELIYGDNNTTMNLPLDVDETYDVDTGYYTVHIQILSLIHISPKSCFISCGSGLSAAAVFQLFPFAGHSTRMPPSTGVYTGTRKLCLARCSACRPMRSRLPP